jgi:hypothetical protein
MTRGRQRTENVVNISAPVEAALRGALLSLKVSANSDEVVVLKTCNGKIFRSVGMTYQ